MQRLLFASLLACLAAPSPAHAAPPDASSQSSKAEKLKTLLRVGFAEIKQGDPASCAIAGSRRW
jgi:hypothetical protein